MFNNRLVLLNAQFSLKSIYKFSGNHLVCHTYGMDIHLSICVPPFNDDKYAKSERAVQIRIKSNNDTIENKHYLDEEQTEEEDITIPTTSSIGFK